MEQNTNILTRMECYAQSFRIGMDKRRFPNGTHLFHANPSYFCGTYQQGCHGGEGNKWHLKIPAKLTLSLECATIKKYLKVGNCQKKLPKDEKSPKMKNYRNMANCFEINKEVNDEKIIKNSKNSKTKSSKMN